jgi:hypothetical protein
VVRRLPRRTRANGCIEVSGRENVRDGVWIEDYSTV